VLDGAVFDDAEPDDVVDVRAEVDVVGLVRDTELSEGAPLGSVSGASALFAVQPLKVSAAAASAATNLRGRGSDMPPRIRSEPVDKAHLTALT
jgi:hypothetical protein